MTDYVPPDIDECSTTPVSEEGLDSLMSLLFSNIVRTGVNVVTLIVFVNQMLLMMAGDVERNPGPGETFVIAHNCVYYEFSSITDTLAITDLKTLVNELHEVRDKWYHLGVQLNMKTSDLKAIRTKYNNDPDDCLLEMLSSWLSISSPSPTWQNVVDALCCATIARPLTAERIRKEYLTSSHISSSSDRAVSATEIAPGDPASQIKTLEKEFGKLNDCVYESIKSQPVDTFKVRLASVDSKKQKHHETALNEIIGSREKIEDIWIQLGFYMNFLNFELLEHVLDKFEDDIPEDKVKQYTLLQERMRMYIVRIHAFFKSTRVCDFIELWPTLTDSPPKLDLHQFIVKCNKPWHTCTLYDLEQIKDGLARKLLLPKYSLFLQSAHESSITVTFSIPPSLVTQLQCDIQNTELKVFLDMDIEIITVDGVVCYVAPLLQYTTQLKQLYTSRSPLQPLTDSKPKSLLQFRLARIEKQTISQGGMDRFTRESLRGDMDDVIYKKTAMDVSELGVMPDNSQPKVVLIEGAPGVGKTTFAWDQCRQWAEGKLLQDYSIVLLLPLRDNNIRQITSLPRLFRHSKRQVRDEVSRRVVESNGKGCLIWLEAWDELVNDLRSDSLFTQLIQGIQLPAATIYITSRPWATRHLLEQMGDRISQHTELLALAKEEVENEIRGIIITIHSMTESESGFDFRTHIESNPMIRAAMYTPVSAAIVEQVFKSSPHNPPTTVTQLYSAYVLMRLEQYLTEHPKYSDMKMKVRTLSDLPERVLTDFHQLCRLAYLGVSQQMIVFSSLPEGVSSTLGLLQSVPQVYDEGEDQVSYNFLHYTVQEYLAALHISHLQPQEQMTIIDTKCLRIVTRTEYGREYYEAIQWKTTFQFLAGITKLVDYPVEFLSNLLSKDEVTMYSCLYESQNLPLLTSVLGSGKRDMRLSYSATITDYFVAGYCLADSNCTWSIVFESVDDVAMEFLSKGCNHQLPETDISSQLVSLSSSGSITAESVKQFLTIPNSLIQHIQHLELYGNNNLDRRACDVLAEGVQRMPCLEILILNNNSHIGCGGAVQLLSSLHSSKLRQLDMDETGINDPDFECLASYIHSTTSLQELSIGRNDISVESIDSLCKALSTNSSIRSLDMHGCHLTTSHCVCLGQLLRHPIHCKIEKLDLRRCSLTSDGVGEVMSGLSDNHTLRHLELRVNNQIRSEGAVTIATMLKTNSSLETLYLDWCSIDSSGGVELGRALERNKTLRALWLSGNTLGDDGVRGLIVGLENNSSLEVLRLEGEESLGEEGVSLLLKCVEEKNTSLKTLWLPEKYKSIAMTSKVMVR